MAFICASEDKAGKEQKRSHSGLRPVFVTQPADAATICGGLGSWTPMVFLERFKKVCGPSCANEDKADKKRNRRHSGATARFCDAVSRCRSKQMGIQNLLKCSSPDSYPG